MCNSKARDVDVSHFGDAQKYHVYMQKEAYWGFMLEEATTIIKRLEGVIEDIFQGAKAHSYP